MSIARRHYIELLGLSGIVILSSRWWEEPGGYQDEHTVEEIVCRRAGKPRRMKVHWVMKVMRGLDYNVEEDKEISEAEYEGLCQEYDGIFDTVEYREKLAKRSEIIHQLEELKPLCLQCQIPMVHRVGPYGDFWGCSRYPKCKCTRPLTASLKARIDELSDELDKYRNL